MRQSSGRRNAADQGHDAITLWGIDRGRCEAKT